MTGYISVDKMRLVPERFLLEPKKGFFFKKIKTDVISRFNVFFNHSAVIWPTVSEMMKTSWP